MKKFFLFQCKGITDRFFCGNIYEAEPTDEIRYHGQEMTFESCVNFGVCKEFNSRKEANIFSKNQEDLMEDSNNYANRAMHDEETFGCEGVDNCLND